MQYSSEVVPLKSFKTTVKLFVEIVDPQLLRIASRCAFVTVQIDLRSFKRYNVLSRGTKYCPLVLMAL